MQRIEDGDEIEACIAKILRASGLEIDVLTPAE